MKLVWLIIQQNIGKMIMILGIILCIVATYYDDGQYEYEIVKYQRMETGTIYVMESSGVETLLGGRCILKGNVMYQENNTTVAICLVFGFILTVVLFGMTFSDDSDQNFDIISIRALMLSEKINVISENGDRFHYILQDRLIYTSDHLMNCQGSYILSNVREFVRNKNNFAIYTTNAAIRSDKIIKILKS